jgi:hypothetical protein
MAFMQQLFRAPVWDPEICELFSQRIFLQYGVIYGRKSLEGLARRGKASLGSSQ